MNWFAFSKLKLPSKTEQPKQSKRKSRKKNSRNFYVDVFQLKSFKDPPAGDVFCTVETKDPKQQHRTKVVSKTFVWNERHYFSYTGPTEVKVKLYLSKQPKPVCLGKVTVSVNLDDLKSRSSYPLRARRAGGSEKTIGEIGMQIGCISRQDEKQKQQMEEQFVIRRSLILAQPVIREEEQNESNAEKRGSRIKKDSETDFGSDSDSDSDSEDSSFSMYSLSMDIPGYDPSTFIEFDDDEEGEPEKKKPANALISSSSSKRGSGSSGGSGGRNSKTTDDEFDFQKDDFDQKINLSDWNSRFQSIIDKIKSFTHKTDHPAKMMAYLNLIHLGQDFLYNAKVYGKIIISERYLDNEHKTIKKVEVGGFAGGEKYIKNNILFKVAIDSKSLFGEDADIGAQKTGGHELKGLQCYFDCDVKNLHFPLMALVDYRGHRLIAMSILPIDEYTLVLNSNDGGRHMNNKCPELQEKMKQAAEILNLKPHMAGINENNRILTYTAADCEGHRDKDGRFYLLDFARVLPPEAPRLEHNQITPEELKKCLYQRLRKEFIKNYDKKLCSDSFSGFISGHERLICDLEIIEATKSLYEKVIPELAQELPLLLYQLGKKVEDKGDIRDVAFSFFRLTETIHSRGVNMRHLGKIVAQLKNIPLTSTISPRNNSTPLSSSSGDVRSGSFSATSPPMQLLVSDCKRLLILEMFARAIKTYLQRELREKMSKFKTPLEEPYRRLVIKFLNCVFGNSATCERFWEEKLKPEVIAKFSGWDFNEETNEFRYSKNNPATSSPRPEGERLSSGSGSAHDLLSWRRSGNGQTQTPLSQAIMGFSYLFNSHIDGRVMLLLRIQKLMGLRFTPKSQKNFIMNPQKLTFPNPFDANDLDEVGERVKHMNLFAHAEGYSLMMHGLRQRATGASVTIPLLQQAIEKFEEALDTSFYSKVLLRDCASCLLHLHLEYIAQNGVDSTKKESHLLERANLYYQSAIKMDPNDPMSLLEYAKFLDKCELLYQAEDYFLRVLELDSLFVVGLRYYGYFLEKLELREQAEKFFLRARETEFRRNPQRFSKLYGLDKAANGNNQEKDSKEKEKEKEKKNKKKK